MAQGSPDNHPSVITGGCLCGSVTYELHFPWGSAWPPAPHDCQCTQCRKWTGSLICPWIGVKPSQITWPSSNNPNSTSSCPQGMKNYAEYSSSPGCFRGFCNHCGGTLLWRSEKSPQEVGITTGSIDEKSLIGSKEGCDSPHQGRQGLEVGKALSEPIGGHLWLENAIKGVTDEVKVGKKYLNGFDGLVLA